MKSYEEAKERYAQYGVDTDGALEALAKVSISLHCWQGDDVCGFESDVLGLGGDGIQTTGNYPGKARTGDELRSDLECAHRQIPGGHRLNLHALYAETDGKAVDRNELQPEHFSRWIDWAGEKGIGLDFNPSLFSHPKTESGFTLASQSHRSSELVPLPAVAWLRSSEGRLLLGPAAWQRVLSLPVPRRQTIPRKQ